MTAFLHRTREVREVAEAALAPAATRSTASKGRARAEEPDPHRTCFERDRDRILHSKAFRRLKHKTQVFIDPIGDHYVTRLTHALQVTQVARALATGLGLNEPLAEAIALGHDVGHSPFGHTGEEALSAYVEGGWHHAAQSVRIYEVLEDANLTWEVRDGIRAHSWKIDPPPATPEGACVRFADRIAYLSHDTLDAMRAGVLHARDLPPGVSAHLGRPGSEWVGTMIRAVIAHSAATGELGMAPETAGTMGELRAFLFDRLYHSRRTEDQRQAVLRVVGDLVEYHLTHPEEIPASYRDAASDAPTQTVDYVAGMTDRYALALHARLNNR